RRLDVVAEAHRRQLLVGAGARLGVPAVDDFGQRGRRAPLTAAHLVDEGVVGDAPQPAFEGTGLEVLEAPADAQEDLLDQVGGVVGIAAESIREVVDLPPMRSCHVYPGQRSVGHGLSLGSTTTGTCKRFPVGEIYRRKPGGAALSRTRSTRRPRRLRRCPCGTPWPTHPGTGRAPAACGRRRGRAPRAGRSTAPTRRFCPYERPPLPAMLPLWTSQPPGGVPAPAGPGRRGPSSPRASGVAPGSRTGCAGRAAPSRGWSRGRTSRRPAWPGRPSTARRRR